MAVDQITPLAPMRLRNRQLQDCGKQVTPAQEPLSPTKTRHDSMEPTTPPHEVARPPVVESMLPTPASSPRPQKTDALPEDELAGRVATQECIFNLSERLGLNENLCGVANDSGTPCKNKVGRKKRVGREKAEIDVHLEPLITLTQSSDLLDTQLDILAGIANCHCHKSAKYRKSRVDSWLILFPPGDVATKPDAYIGRNIKKILGQRDRFCIQHVGEDQSCREKIGGQRVQNCTRTINKLLEPKVYSNDQSLQFYIQVFLANRYCHLHVKPPSTEDVASMMAEIKSVIVSTVTGDFLSIQDQPPGYSNVAPNTPRPALKQCNPEEVELGAAKQPGRSLSTELTDSSPFNFSQDPALFWKPCFDKSPLKLVCSTSNSGRERKCHRRLGDIMRKAIKKNDQKDGHIYLYEVEGNPSFVKLGYTTRECAQRHQEWTFECNRKSKALYPPDSGISIKVPNACRVEELCHAELSSWNRLVDCNGCLIQHKEWFEVSPEEAIVVIRKWTAWMNTQPYCEAEDASAESRVLREEVRQEVFDIEKFMHKLSRLGTNSPGAKT